nr:hypothetical protein [Tanacetum cinerariifolium]
TRERHRERCPHRAATARGGRAPPAHAARRGGRCRGRLSDSGQPYRYLALPSPRLQAAAAAAARHYPGAAGGAGAAGARLGAAGRGARDGRPRRPQQHRPRPAQYEAAGAARGARRPPATRAQAAVCGRLDPADPAKTNHRLAG